MENFSNPMQPSPAPSKSKLPLIILIIVLIVIVAVGLWYFLTQPVVENTDNSDLSQLPTQETFSAEDSISNINSSLNSVDLGGLDKEFQDVDQDLKSL